MADFVTRAYPKARLAARGETSLDLKVFPSPAPEQWDAFLNNIGNMWATEPNFTPEQLGAITTPLLILDGKKEEAIDTNHTNEMADLIPGAELHLIPGTGHFAMWDKPMEFNHIVLDFLQQ